MLAPNICGYAGEQIFDRQLKAAKLQKIKFNATELIITAQSLPVGQERIRQALPYLLSEYGKQMGKKFMIDWQDVPASAILDYVYGIDSLFTFRGWNIAIDVTVNPNAIIDKSTKIQRLKPLWSAIGIDYGAIALIHRNCTVKETTAALRLIIQGATVIEL
jgi:hypothetical protein